MSLGWRGKELRMKCCRERVEGSIEMHIRRAAAVNGDCIELENFGISSFDLWCSNARWLVKLGLERKQKIQKS
jgi:hypothetical protein